MKEAVFSSVFAEGRVRLKAGCDAFQDRYGAMIEFLDPDNSIRDFEGLERDQALALGMCLIDLASEGLDKERELALRLEVESVFAAQEYRPNLEILFRGFILQALPEPSAKDSD